MRRGIGLVAAFAVSAAVACSDSRAGSLPTVSPSPSASFGTPSTSASVDLAASLRAALTTYFDALYAAGLDPANKTDALAGLISPSCTCYRAVEVLREQARKGRHVDYRYSVREVKVIDVGALGGNVSYAVTQSAGALRDESGRALENYRASTEKYSAHFSRQDGHWVLDRVEMFK